MPQKLRELPAELMWASFVIKRQVGSHEQWKHST